MSDETFAYHRHLQDIVKQDIEYVLRKDVQYKSSWKQRGGVGAFFTIARPWDRLESITAGAGYDMFAKIASEGLSGPDGSLIACVRDLRRYLMLVEAEMMERASREGGPSPRSGTPEDGGQHASSFPWVLYGAGAACHLSEDLREAAYFPQTAGVLVLEACLPHVVIDRLPPVVKRCYFPVRSFMSGEVRSFQRLEPPVDWLRRPDAWDRDGPPDIWWLDADLIPEDERCRWTTYPQELALTTVEEVGEAICLYSWDAPTTRYRLRERAWGQEP